MDNFPCKTMILCWKMVDSFAIRGMRASVHMWVKPDELCIRNEKLCIKNEEFCIKIDEFCSKIPNLTKDGSDATAKWVKMMNLYLKRGILH